MTDGMAITGDGTATTADEGITADDMTGITIGVMFVMTTGGTITSRRFARISKIFAMHAMKSNRAAGSCAGIIRSREKIERSFGAISAMAPARERSMGTAKRSALT